MKENRYFKAVTGGALMVTTVAANAATSVIDSATLTSAEDQLVATVDALVPWAIGLVTVVLIPTIAIGLFKKFGSKAK